MQEMFCSWFLQRVHVSLSPSLEPQINSKDLCLSKPQRSFASSNLAAFLEMSCSSISSISCTQQMHPLSYIHQLYNNRKEPEQAAGIAYLKHHHDQQLPTEHYCAHTQLPLTLYRSGSISIHSVHYWATVGHVTSVKLKNSAWIRK